MHGFYRNNGKLYTFILQQKWDERYWFLVLRIINHSLIKLKELVQVLWQRRKFYGYVRIAKRIRKLLKCRLSDHTIW